MKALTPKQRLELVGQIEISNKAKPTRRVWIPKPGREEKRPLGIPTMYDRATQGWGRAGNRFPTLPFGTGLAIFTASGYWVLGPFHR